MNVILIVLAGLLAALAARRQRRKHRQPPLAVIVSPPGSNAIAKNGAVTSAQSAELTISQADLERLWNPTNLENLARTYWKFLSRVTLGLIRVVYGENERRVVLLARPLTLLRFDPPVYVIEDDHGKVCWRIRDGLLVARPGRGSGYLELDVRREPPDPGSPGVRKLKIEVAVTNFYPSIAAGFSTPVYKATQSVIHVLVTHSFLRSLADLELAESRIGSLAPPAQPAEEPEQSATAQP
ncbi:MAG: hypothetical protein QOD66_3588 [Solirubrobacteraceae bacterium]|nr:hypothetical protein [Solirubrobacteraceae bacterium]